MVAQFQPGSQWGAPSATSHSPHSANAVKSTAHFHSIYKNANQAQGIGQGRVTGCCNVKGPQDPNPLTHWPSENFPIWEGAKRPGYDDLSQSQFISGILANILERSLPMHRIAMIRELKAVMDTATTSGWPVAKSIVGDVMAKIESGRLQWTDEYALWQARVDSKSDGFSA